MRDDRFDSFKVTYVNGGTKKWLSFPNSSRNPAFRLDTIGKLKTQQRRCFPPLGDPVSYVENQKRIFRLRESVTGEG